MGEVKWTEESVIEAIRAIAGPKNRICYSDIENANPYLLKAIQSRFISARDAVESAGVVYYRKNTSKEPTKSVVSPEPVILSVPEEYRKKYASKKRPKCGWF